jgi:hypothetical protein
VVTAKEAAAVGQAWVLRRTNEEKNHPSKRDKTGNSKTNRGGATGDQRVLILRRRTACT